MKDKYEKVTTTSLRRALKKATRNLEEGCIKSSVSSGLIFPGKRAVPGARRGYHIFVTATKFSESRLTIHPETDGLLSIATKGERSQNEKVELKRLGEKYGWAPAPPEPTYWQRLETNFRNVAVCFMCGLGAVTLARWVVYACLNWF